MRTSKFSVKGMHCPSCEMLIVESLEELNGIEKAEASHKKEEVLVVYDEQKVNKENIRKEIVDEGYKVN